ncbi:amine oxidase [Ophiocordyceps camponoti-floridani]|uniref:Amine oxidase n=1 Tax=Ophiocordyceps camponoti-floridani TaxID=2030778 RepID=A0A8H4Q207_9HYPO|nr:amine oxidase [Ophiocordyceps camponoti-floridani]
MAVKPRVAIVGAGIAGLRCGQLLQGRGFRVTILEGRNRIGGRVEQQKLSNGHLVDMGPNWIHGTVDNPMYDLARQTKTAVAHLDSPANVLDESGSRLTSGERYADVMWDVIQEAFDYSNKNCAEIDVDKSLVDFFHEKLPVRFPDGPDSERDRRLVLQLAESWGDFVGSPVSRQSLKFFWLEECIDGENLFCAGTYSKILDVISKPVLAESELLLDTKVTKISCRQGPGDKTRVEVDDGRVLWFDDVVVTCPLGWLKRKVDDAFEPALPERLTRAIGSLGYGCLEKVYVSFPKAFWLSGHHQARGFMQWLAPSYAPGSNPQRWIQEAVELASLEPGSSHPTLLFYIYGDQSRHVTAKMASLQTDSQRHDFLSRYFQPYYSRLPGYEAGSPDCVASASLATTWVLDELAGFGSYTNFQVGLREADDDIQVMREGLPERGLWFAGEHTAPFVAVGTATGAFWSGESVAKRLAEAYGLSSERGSGSEGGDKGEE